MRIGVFRKTSLPEGTNVAMKRKVLQTNEKNGILHSCLLQGAVQIATHHELIITPGKTDEHDHDMP